MRIKLFLFILLFYCLCSLAVAQTNSPSIQTGVTFQWSDNQTNRINPTTIESITVNGTLYYNFGVPSSYELTQLGPGGHNNNKIRENGNFVETTSASATWNASALNSYQSLNLNNYFDSNGNGDNICDDFVAEETTNAQRQTLFYGDGIKSNSSGLIAITERNANNCYHLEFFGIPFGGSVEQSLGETFVNQGSTVEYGFGGTGTPTNLGTPGAVDPPIAGGRDYWLSDRVVDTGGTIGIALFYLDDIAPFGSTITKVQLTAATNDNGDGKLFILTFPDSDQDSLSNIDDLDDDNDGILDTVESGGIDPSGDHDIDGIPNYQDADFCTLNSSGICVNLDFDSDGIPNHLDLDSDNDGITDVLESGGTDANEDGLADGVIGKDILDFGVPNSAGTGTVPTNTDGTGNFDALDIDSDDDGIPDNVEAQSTLAYNTPSGVGLTIVDADENGIDDNYGNGLRPEDTDGDRIYDYVDLDADNDTIPDIQENGMANTISGTDTDADGLDNVFETNGVNDTSLDINEAMDNPSASILPDTDGDLYAGGDLDYRDLFNTNPPASATLDFDGIDDYLTTPSFLNGRTELTLMAWVKADSGSTSDMVIAGENDACKLWLKNGNIPYFTVRLPGFPVRNVATGVLPFNEWHHMAGTYSATTGLLKIFIDGKLKGTYNFGTTGLGIVHSTLGNGAFEIGRLSSNLSNQNYFKGDIDEVRVFDSALTEELIQQMVYQEIEDNGGLIQGKILPKNIEDIKTFETLAWNHLIAYYPMTAIKNSTTSDYSGNNRTLKLRNITSVQHQTAPMPYRTGSDGNWTSTSTWLHGDVWDIEVVSKNKDWSIVDIKHNVTTSNSHTNLGLLIDNNKKLTVNGDQKIDNSWYLELNGTIDLQDDSQLIQGVFSDLVTSATGKILRRQEGNSSVYWYNYWSSPVGELGATALSDNNTSSNNTNNDDYKLNMLKKGDGSNVQFISNAYDEVGKVSTRWLYTYKNGVTYYDYESIDHNSAIEPGVGYTQKGTGTEDSHQQFIFEGKPNNGTILINVTDTGGSGSVPAVSKTDYLLGNPYASALDIHKFIDDNAGVIDGTLQLWQQWSGTSHNLDEYDGGYAQVNKMGSVRAYQFVGIEGDTNGNQDGTKTPTRHLPVGQGFMTEIVANGTIEFNNSQRVFKKESDYNGSYGNGSIFFRTANEPEDDATPESDSEEPLMQKLRLEFSSVDGPATRRELLLGFSDFTSEAYDYGYDAKNVDDNANDLNLLMGEELMTMQAYGPITDDKEVPLALRASGAYNYRIRLTELKDIEEDQEIYLRDNLTGYYFDLRTDQAYEFSSEAGEFNSRFEIVFQSEESLSTQEQEYQYYLIYFSNDNDKLYAKDLKTDVDQLMVINILGQTVKELKDVRSQTLDNGLEISNLSTGTYVIYLKMGTHIETKKIIVN